MSGLKQAIRNIWNHGEDEYGEDETNEPEAAQSEPARPTDSFNSYNNQNPRPSYGGGSGVGTSAGVRRLRPVASPMRAREKNIYTLRPKSQEDAAIAADALKAGDAVIINLEEVERLKAVRIIDFMSGVCYGLEGQGHAMKLGDLIFLYTPPEFEITSDETDYGENPDFFFKDVEPGVPTSSNAPQTGTPSTSATITNVGAPVVTPAPLHAQRDSMRAAQAAQSQPMPSSTQSTTSSQPIPSQPVPQQTLSPQSYASGERRPWER
ncbi:MAG TPA: cell division protein SepF [Abditibacteriaceae bacterium]|nr:cell division protein SepF [Abditibacteriaceae bacterium]